MLLFSCALSSTQDQEHRLSVLRARAGIRPTTNVEDEDDDEDAFGEKRSRTQRGRFVPASKLRMSSVDFVVVHVTTAEGEEIREDEITEYTPLTVPKAPAKPQHVNFFEDLERGEV